VSKKRGQAVQNIVGLLVALIILISVVYPVIFTTISDAGLTGTDAAIANIIPLLILVAGVVLVTGIFLVRS